MLDILDKQRIKTLVDETAFDDFFTANPDFFIREYDKGEILFKKGDSIDTIQFLVNGTVKVETERETHTVAARDDFILLGDVEFVQGNHSSATLEALTPIRTLCIDLNKYKDDLLNDRIFMNYVMRSINRKAGM